MTKKDERKHIRGKDYGYDSDGTNYWLPPALRDMASDIRDEATALDAIVATVVKSVSESRRHLAARERKWWNMVYSDLGLDRTVAYNYRSGDGQLSPLVKDEEPRKGEGEAQR